MGITEKDIETKLHSYIRDARAMEANSLQMMQSMLLHTKDEEMRDILENHIEETKGHEQIWIDRLQGIGETSGGAKKAGALLSAGMKGIVDQLRSDKPGKDARDGFVTEAIEIAAYEMLSRLADRAGDTETSQLARQILAEERAMAERLSKTWDKVIDLTLEEENVQV
ncbi:MAG: ferritin-like domain-containing protein [Actinomycetota bacterium]|nr:ferritin-like domain-containing protein [Actinomycetota bacterium]